MRVSIREHRSDDADAIAALAGQLGYPSTVEQVRMRVESVRAAGEQAVLVAEEGGAVVGWIHVAVRSLIESGPFAEILGLVVEERWRGKGVGVQLVHEAEAWARARGQAVIRVRSNVVREQAHAFYKKLGYHVIKQQAVFERTI